MVGSRLRQTHARMRCMTSRLQRSVSRLLASSPNYVEITALLATALAARVLFLPAFWKVSPQACVAVALFVSILVYACIDRGQLFAYFGWVHPRGRILCLHALLAGGVAATLVIAILHVEQTPLGHTSPARLLYGVTIGPIIEEILFRGAAFSVIYVTAASIKGLLRLRLTIAIVLSSLLFAVAHTRTMGIPWLVFFAMGTLYALLRWRSNSTAAAALMHAAYNAAIALAMLHA
jgi:membrane protease YdiL (CAAX protease family)